MRFMLHHERHLAGFRACIFLMVVLVDLKVGFVGERSALSARLLWYGVLAENAGCFLWDKSRRRVLVCVYAFGMALKEAPTEAETATPPPLAAPPHADPRLTPRRSAAASPPLGIKTFQQVKNKIYIIHTHRGEQKKEARNSFISLARRMHYFVCRPWTPTSLIYFFIVGQLDRWISGSIKHVNWRRERCFKYDFRSRCADGVIKQHSAFFGSMSCCVGWGSEYYTHAVYYCFILVRCVCMYDYKIIKTFSHETAFLHLNLANCACLFLFFSRTLKIVVLEFWCCVEFCGNACVRSYLNFLSHRW
jgi:hypothetical protein